MIFYIFMIILSPFTAIIPLIHAIYLIFKGRVEVELNYWNIGLFLLFSWALIVAVINNSILSFGGAFMLLGLWAISIIAQSMFTTRKIINEALKYVVYCTALAAINGIMEKFVFIALDMPTHRIYSTFGNPNMTGAWFASTIFIVLYVRKCKKTRVEGIIYNVSLVLITLALLLTESSGAFIAFAVSMGVYLLLKKIKNIRTLVIICISGLAVVGMFMFLQKNSYSNGIVNEISNSFNSRVDIWEGSLEMFKEKPLTGWGMLGTLEHGVDYFEKNGNSIHSHNLWLTFLVSTGIVGLIIYLAIKVRLMRDLFTLYNRKDPMLVLIVALNMMVIVQGLVDFSLYAPQLGIMFMVTNGVAINLVRGKVGSNKKRNRQDNIISINEEILAS